MVSAPIPAASRGRWLVSRRFDLGAFLVPALVALALVPLGPLVDGRLPLPMWVIAVLAIDVAHVYGTLFVTYLSPRERRRFRAWLIATPLAGFTASATLLVATSVATFWTVLAYVALFHFVRQQVGWVALYQRKEPELSGWERALDRLAVYAGTLYPVLWWHAHLPRAYAWFLPGDFLEGVVPVGLVPLAASLWGLVLGAFAVVQIGRLATGRGVSWGKVIVVATTAATWGVGIVATNSDWAFTLTNVIVHGVPYTAFVWHRAERRVAGRAVSLSAFALILVGLAYAEELMWDRLVWHDVGPALFPGPAVVLPDLALRVVVALLVLPQLTHYILDARIWRRSAERASGSSGPGIDPLQELVTSGVDGRAWSEDGPDPCASQKL